MYKDNMNTCVIHLSYVWMMTSVTLLSSTKEAVFVQVSLIIIVTDILTVFPVFLHHQLLIFISEANL